MQLNHLASLVKWLSVELQTNPVAVTETPDIVPVSSKEFLDIQAAIECRFTPKRVRNMRTNTVKYNVQISTHNTAQSFGQFG